MWFYDTFYLSSISIPADFQVAKQRGKNKNAEVSINIDEDAVEDILG